MRSELLVDAKQFMEDLDKTIRGAKETVQVQSMTFEGDYAGIQVMEALIASKAKNRQLLIDSYSKVVINDHFVFGPYYFISPAFRKEIRETKSLIQKGLQNGIEVKFTNPTGLLMHRYPLRNHKKMVVVDQEVSYIGGINFSEHNFQWHDAMIRVEDRQVSNALSDDFESTWSGINQSRKVALGDTMLYFMNGSRSKPEYEDIFGMIEKAKKTIDIFSPYVSDPLLSRIKNRKNKDVKVRIISSEKNNKSVFKKHLGNELRKGYFQLWHYLKGMSHLKAILIDQEILIMGSSNFDIVSYYFEQEVILVSRNLDLIAEFNSKVYSKDLEESIQVDPNDIKESKNTAFLMQLLNWAAYKGSTYLLSTR